MKTIAQALIDEIHYPLPYGFIENKLLVRGLDGDCEISSEVLVSREFRGATADCLYSLIEAPNISESDKSISISDKNLIIEKMNRLYSSIGEPEEYINSATVQFG